MIKATILAVGASAAVFSAMLAAPAQAAPVGGDHGPCQNSAGNGGLLGLGLLNFQQNNCDIDFVNGHMGHHHGGDWD